MTREKGRNGLKSEERRRFLEISTKYGFTAAVVAGAAGTLGSSEAAAQTAKEEKERQKAAEFSMTMATAYILGASRSYPIMQLDFKENVQNATNGKIYVKLAPGGQLGAGGALAQKVQNGTIQAAQHSLSNFAPFAPVVDLINLPYFCGANQKFVNLVNSEAWKAEVTPKSRPRASRPCGTWSSTRVSWRCARGGDGPIKTPADLSGIKFRVPGSKMLQQYYRMIGANPTPVAWGETPSAIKQGVADALDPAVGALYVFGFNDILSWVTFSQAVPDSQVYSCNLEWFRACRPTCRTGSSSPPTSRPIRTWPRCRRRATMPWPRCARPASSSIPHRRRAWRNGSRPAAISGREWEGFKTELAGSLDAFGKLEEAANTQSHLYVHDA